jgi:hypothetical protein
MTKTGVSTAKQKYDQTPIINELRGHVDKWRTLPNPNQWHVTPETARLLQHWRHHRFSSIRPFFCQVEAIETLIWLAEVAPQLGKEGRKFLEHLDAANADANPGLARLALKLATGAGKTTVMAMIIAWQTVNAVRRPNSRKFTRGFLVVSPGLTIKDRLRVPQPYDPDSYRREDAKEKKATMETYWAPGVNNLDAYGRWTFAEFTDVWEIQKRFSEMIDRAVVDASGAPAAAGSIVGPTFRSGTPGHV